jgi:hypothetical protein
MRNSKMKVFRFFSTPAPLIHSALLLYLLFDVVVFWRAEQREREREEIEQSTKSKRLYSQKYHVKV